MELIFEAIREGDEGEVERLLDADPALLEVEDRRTGKMPLTVAAEHGQLRLARLLIERGADANAIGRDRTALHWAALKGHEDVVVFLLSVGAQANVRDAMGSTPFILACFGGHVPVIQILQQHLGPRGLEDGDSGGSTALHVAAEGGHVEVVALLMHKGARANTMDITGSNALEKAEYRGHVGVVQWFVENLGVEVLAPDGGLGMVALHEAAGGGRDKVVRFLLLAGADPTVVNEDGLTPREIAVDKQEWGEEEEDGFEGLVRCVAVFDWWEGELERTAVLHRATCLHKAFSTQQSQPTSQVPPYLEARVAAGLAMPSVEVVSQESDPVEEETHAMLEYVVNSLNEELLTELLEGFHVGRGQGNEE